MVLGMDGWTGGSASDLGPARPPSFLLPQKTLPQKHTNNKHTHRRSQGMRRARWSSANGMSSRSATRTTAPPSASSGESQAASASEASASAAAGPGCGARAEARAWFCFVVVFGGRGGGRGDCVVRGWIRRDGTTKKRTGKTGRDRHTNDARTHPLREFHGARAHLAGLDEAQAEIVELQGVGARAEGERALGGGEAAVLGGEGDRGVGWGVGVG